MKYLRIASDLHLEGFRGRPIAALAAGFLPPDPRDKESVLVLAGDVSSFPDQVIDFLNEVADQFATVFFVTGNHCYYRHDFDELNQILTTAQLKPNILVGGANLIEHKIPGFRLLGLTLWGDGGKDAIERTWVDRGLNDFRLIRRNGTRFSADDMLKEHRRQKQELVAALKVPFDGKTIVVSHHMPSYRLCHPRFGTSINGGFASNCDDILAYDHAPVLWIHGHTHDRISTRLWKTAIECNPAGYRGEWGTAYNTYLEGPVFVDLEDLHG